ncbi:MAG: AraC family transcriptional regulator, partial [Sphingobacteriales bacterium]
LIETDMQVAEICYHSGYESISFFYRQFKKVKNCSPQHFRASFKQTGDHMIPSLLQTAS